MNLFKREPEIKKFLYIKPLTIHRWDPVHHCYDYYHITQTTYDLENPEGIVIGWKHDFIGDIHYWSSNNNPDILDFDKGQIAFTHCEAIPFTIVEMTDEDFDLWRRLQ